MSDSGSRTGHAIKRAEQALIAAKESVLRPLGLTVPQYAALLALSEEPGAGGAELARRCLVTPQTMSTVLSNLQSKNLIERRPHRLHRRVVETCITDAGQDLLSRADTAALTVESALDAALDGQATQLRDLLTTAADALIETRARRSEHHETV
jgi:DNA-binding MarR family transcriptional regulator